MESILLNLKVVSHFQPLETCVQAGQKSPLGLPGKMEEGEVSSVAKNESIMFFFP